MCAGWNGSDAESRPLQRSGGRMQRAGVSSCAPPRDAGVWVRAPATRACPPAPGPSTAACAAGTSPPARPGAARRIVAVAAAGLPATTHPCPEARERGPVPPHHLEDRAVATLVLDGDELLRRDAVFHRDEVGALLAVDHLGYPERRREILAPEPEERLVRLERRDVIARPTEDRLHESLGDPALGLQKIHRASSDGSETSAKKALFA